MSNNIKNTNNIRPPFFPGSTQSPSRIKARNDAKRKQELDQITKDHTSVSINQKIKDFSRIKKMVDASSEIDRSDKIMDLKNQIKNGTYMIDEGKIAEKILENEY